MKDENKNTKSLFVYSFAAILLYSAGFAPNSAATDRRIVSLVPSATKMLADLGCGSWLVGITKYCERPKDATEAQVIGSIQTPSLELIASLRPTLVLADVESNRRATVDRLGDLGIPVLVLDNSRTLNDLIVAFKRVADKIGVPHKADSYLREFYKKLKRITERIKDKKPKRVFVEVWNKPLITASSKSFIHNIVETAGGENVFADGEIAYPKISMESVIARKPEVILILSNMDAETDSVSDYKTYSPLRSCEIVQVDSSDLTIPCLSSFLSSVEIVADILHPKNRNKKDEK